MIQHALATPEDQEVVRARVDQEADRADHQESPASAQGGEHLADDRSGLLRHWLARGRGGLTGWHGPTVPQARGTVRDGKFHSRRR
ncbi:hypothetical protein IFM12276_66040 [Nocardia sputorum]|uniref:DUF222 domain-containing protein n=1 Tax=Nocardia sputorum TaxID=2984338 RepID=A0ABN6UGJ6_9NOCA|nr:hypothetical protein IFM12276_66040 [Nocardia sputorum]